MTDFLASVTKVRQVLFRLLSDIRQRVLVEHVHKGSKRLAQHWLQDAYRFDRAFPVWAEAFDQLKSRFQLGDDVPNADVLCILCQSDAAAATASHTNVPEMAETVDEEKQDAPDEKSKEGKAWEGKPGHEEAGAELEVLPALAAEP